MITDALFGVFFNILEWFTNLLPTTGVNTVLSGLPAMGSFLGQVIGITKAFIPWGDFLLMLGILLAISGVRLILQVVNLIWP